MAFFAVAPGFVRASIRLRDIDAGRAAAQARGLLRKAVAGSGTTATAAWHAVYAAIGLPEGTVAPQEALAAWAESPGGVPSQGPLADLVHATSLRLALPAAAYDLSAVSGDLWLRPARGVELFQGLPGPSGASARPESVPINEPILADGSDRCLARAWHGTQAVDTMTTPATCEALVHVDALDGDAERMEVEAKALARLLQGFLGGSAEPRLLHRAAPVADWRT